MSISTLNGKRQPKRYPKIPMTKKLRDPQRPDPKMYLNSGKTHAEAWTPERRKRQSELAKRMAADGNTLFASPESGRMGAAARKAGHKTMLQTVAERGAERGSEIADALDTMLRSSNHRKQLDAIDRYTRVAESDAKNQREREKEIGAMSEDALKALLLERLFEMYGIDDVQSEAEEIMGDTAELSGPVDGEPEIAGDVLERLAKEERWEGDD